MAGKERKHWPASSSTNGVRSAMATAICCGVRSARSTSEAQLNVLAANGRAGPPAPEPRARRRRAHAQRRVANAASKAEVEGSIRAIDRTNCSASGAPASRSMPASSHSTESGPR